MNGFLHTVNLPRSIISGDHNPCAYSDPIEETDHEKDQASGRTDRRQRFTAEKIPHDQGICRIIELLKEIAEKERNGKGHEFLPDGTFCHEVGLTVVFHGLSSSFLL